MHQEMNFVIVCTCWDGRHVIVWRNTSEEGRFIVTVHDISGSGPFDIAVTPTQACPDEGILMDIPWNILEVYGGYPTQYIGFGGKAVPG